MEKLIQDSNWDVMGWDELFMRHAYLIGSKSKDTYSKIGSVIVRDNAIISEGFNGIPRRVSDDIDTRYMRPEKYYWFEHGERNAIYHCARNGIKTDGSIIYCFGTPCSDCTRAIINCGIKEIIIHKQWESIGFNNSNEKWSESIMRSNSMLTEAGINIKVFDMFLNVKTMIDGKIYII